MAGDIQALLISLPSIDSLVKAGKLRIISVSSSKRFPQLPDTRTLAEAYPGMVIEGRFILMAPAGLPAGDGTVATGGGGGGSRDAVGGSGGSGVVILKWT